METRLETDDEALQGAYAAVRTTEPTVGCLSAGSSSEGRLVGCAGPCAPTCSLQGGEGGTGGEGVDAELHGAYEWPLRATAGAGGITEPLKAYGGVRMATAVGAASGVAVEAGLPGEAPSGDAGDHDKLWGGVEGAAMTASNFALSSSICRTSARLLAVRAAAAAYHPATYHPATYHPPHNCSSSRSRNIVLNIV